MIDLVRRLSAGLAALVATAAIAGVAQAQCPSSTVLKVIDAAGHTQVTCAVVLMPGGQVLPGTEIYGTDGAGNYYQLLTDGQGHILVQGGNSVAVKVDGSAVTQPISAASLPLPANGAQETGGNLAAGKTDLDGIATSSSATASSTSTTATNTASTATSTASTASEIGATSTPAAGSVNAQLATVSTNTGSTATNTATTNTDVGPPGATACATDTGSCSLNALMQRVAQRLTTLNTTLGSPFQAGGSIGNTTFAATESGTWTVQPGNTANATPWLFTLSQGGNAATVTAGNALKVDGSAVTQPVSAAALPLPANAAQETGGHLAAIDTSTSSTATNTSTTATNTATTNTDLGAPGATTCATDTSSCSLNALMQRLAQRLTTLNTTLGSPFQAGGSIGNTTFGATESGTWTVQPGNTANTTPWLFTMSQGGNAATVTGANALKVDGSAVTQPVSGTVTANVQTSSSTNGSGSIATGGTFQTLLASNSSRKGCLVQNPPTATEVLYVSVAIATGSATVAKSVGLTPGATFNCNAGGLVVTDNIAVEAATTGHAFVEIDQ